MVGLDELTALIESRVETCASTGTTFVQSFSICQQRVASEGLSIAVEEDGNKMFTLLFAEDLLGNEYSTFLQSLIRLSRHGAALVKAENDGIFSLYLHFLFHS